MVQPGAFDREYFEHNYRHYERQNPPSKMKFYVRLVQEGGNLPSHPRVLDIGCAFGTFLGSLDSEWELFGMDLSHHAVARARPKLPRAHFLVSSVLEAQFKSSFDVITAFDVIEHVEDLDQVAKSILSKLSRNGLFVFVVPVYDGPLGLLVRLLDRDPTHVHKKSRDFWLDWARRHFIVDGWYGILRYLLPGGVYLHWPTRIGRRWTPAVAILARSPSRAGLGEGGQG